jgi:predicted O-linked N-acetylglucosamine transferase (SPINDLY family)
MGSGFMDYIIADPIVAPFDQQPFFAEKIVHLPDCYQANDSKRVIAAATPSRKEAGLPEQGFIFCCFNNNWKITAAIFQIWLRLLGAVPGSVLWLLEGSREASARLRAEASASGIDPQRLVFAPRIELEQHLARHRLADLFLDTLPYNAHTTASDALWAGLPLVTCKGASFASRVAASLLHAIGLPELVTHNLEDYEALALRLARDKALLGSFRVKLDQNRLTCPLFDTDRFRRNIETAYAKMLEIAERGGAPQNFSVEPET